MMSDSTKAGALRRLEKDVEKYHAEIEKYNADIKKCNADIKTAEDEYAVKHLRRLLDESQRALADVLMRIEGINRGNAQF